MENFQGPPPALGAGFLEGRRGELGDELDHGFHPGRVVKQHGLAPATLALLAGIGMLVQPRAEAAEPIAGRPLYAVHEDPEAFLFQSPGRDLGGTPAAALGPLADFFGTFMSHEAQVAGGRKVVQQFKLADPAPAIAAGLGNDLCPLIACSDILHQFRDDALTLSVRTTAWAVTHLSFAWNRYRIYYKVDARLLDTTADRVVASGEYVYSETFENANEAPLLEDLLGDEAALLKTKFREVEPLAVAELNADIEKDLRRRGFLNAQS